MKDTKTGVKSKVEVSPKIAVGVILVCIGVALGAIAFNALVPTMLTPSADTITMAAVTMNPASGWTLVFGVGKNTAADYDNLLTAIKNGAEVRVDRLATAISNYELPCQRVALYNSGAQIDCLKEEVAYISYYTLSGKNYVTRGVNQMNFTLTKSTLAVTGKSRSIDTTTEVINGVLASTSQSKYSETNVTSSGYNITWFIKN